MGTAQLAPALAASPRGRPGCIVGEPTGMRRATAHKGKLARRVRVRRRRPAHSALAPLGLNAVEEAAHG